mgnify:CR=1 FL=1
MNSRTCLFLAMRKTADAKQTSSVVQSAQKSLRDLPLARGKQLMQHVGKLEQFAQQQSTASQQAASQASEAQSAASQSQQAAQAQTDAQALDAPPPPSQAPYGVSLMAALHPEQQGGPAKPAIPNIPKAPTMSKPGA